MDSPPHAVLSGNQTETKKKCHKMSHLEDLPLQTQIRLSTIKQMKLHKKTQTEIAGALKVSRRTIIRDIEKWAKTDDFRRWALEIFFDKIGKVSDKDALHAVIPIITKNIVSKAEIETTSIFTERQEVAFKLDPADRKLLESAARKYIKTSHTRKPTSIH